MQHADKLEVSPIISHAHQNANTPPLPFYSLSRGVYYENFRYVVMNGASEVELRGLVE